MRTDLATRISALIAGAALIGCGGGGSSSADAAANEAATAAAAESAKQAAAMVAVTPVPRECATE